MKTTNDSPEAWAADLDLSEVAEDAAALVAGWRAIEHADERGRVEREQIGAALEASWPAGVGYDWMEAAIVAAVELQAVRDAYSREVRDSLELAEEV